MYFQGGIGGAGASLLQTQKLRIGKVREVLQVPVGKLAAPWDLLACWGDSLLPRSDLCLKDLSLRLGKAKLTAQGREEVSEKELFLEKCSISDPLLSGIILKPVICSLFLELACRIKLQSSSVGAGLIAPPLLAVFLASSVPLLTSLTVLPTKISNENLCPQIFVQGSALKEPILKCWLSTQNNKCLHSFLGGGSDTILSTSSPSSEQPNYLVDGFLSAFS